MTADNYTINKVYRNILENKLSDNLLNPFLLIYNNNDCTFISIDILNETPGVQTACHSYNKIICNNNEINNYPI